MRAARYHETGTPDVIRVEEVPTPRPGPGEALIKVRAAALNRLDLFLRGGHTRMPGWKLPHIGGFDFSGELADVGPGVDRAKLPNDIMIKARVRGPQATGRLDIVGIARPGGLAEYVVAPIECLAPKPEAYSWEEAAAYPCCHLTAYYGLIHHGKLRPGETLFVHAAGSGAGAAACQVARVAGARVIATAGSDEKCKRAQELLKVDHMINYKTQDVVKRVMEITDGQGAHVVFDPVWGSTTEQTVELLAYNGRWVLLGMVNAPTAQITAAKIMFREISIHGIVEFFAEDAQVMQAFELARQDRLRPIIDSVWPLEKTAEAQHHMERAGSFGKIVVKP